MAANAGTYGALELKRAYQSHFGWGLILGITLHAGAVLWLAVVLNSDTIVGPVVLPEDTVPTKMIPLPKLTEILTPRVPMGQSVPVKSKVGIPVAIPDEDIPLDYVPPVWENPSAGSGRIGPDGGNGAAESNGAVLNSITPAESEIFPTPNDFVAVESLPVPIKSVPPVFPEVAQLTGREGSVVIRALVDREGVVRKAEVVVPSGTNVGFDDAAVAAALLCRYKPAIQNGMPVAVWVTYRVDFKLK